MNATYEWLAYQYGRVVCRVLRIHTSGCRGRRDHDPGAGIWWS